MSYRRKTNINRKQSRPRRRNKIIDNRKKLNKTIRNNHDNRINILKPNSNISCPVGYYICGQECCPNNPSAPLRWR